MALVSGTRFRGKGKAWGTKIKFGETTRGVVKEEWRKFHDNEAVKRISRPTRKLGERRLLPWEECKGERDGGRGTHIIKEVKRRTLCENRDLTSNKQVEGRNWT